MIYVQVKKDCEAAVAVGKKIVYPGKSPTKIEDKYRNTVDFYKKRGCLVELASETMEAEVKILTGRCKAKTASGTQCKRDALSGKDYCRQHLKE